ncbi:unnamed protein product [Lepidochelys kempii]
MMPELQLPKKDLESCLERNSVLLRGTQPTGAGNPIQDKWNCRAPALCYWYCLLWGTVLLRQRNTPSFELSWVVVVDSEDVCVFPLFASDLTVLELCFLNEQRNLIQKFPKSIHEQSKC